MHRHNAFAVEPETRTLPRKEARPPTPDRLKPTVSRDMAEIAGHLGENPVFQDLFGLLKQEATQRLCNSPLGLPGAEIREVARYELEALFAIETRLQSIAAELPMHDAREQYADS